MFKLSYALLAVLALAGCSHITTRAHARNMISFSEFDGEGRPVRQLSLILTNEPTRTCIAGDWKKATVVSDASSYTHNPAYTLENGKLEVLLINQMCDVYDSYIGELSSDQFQGEHVAYGLSFNRSLGKVSGIYKAN